MTNTTQHIYAAPDLRKQTIKDAENFITVKRAKRLILVQSYKEKTVGKLNTLKDKELATFTSRVTRVDNAMEKVTAALQHLENAIANLSSTNSNLANIENQERLL